MVSEIETEITEATEFKLPKGGYSNRQDHLAALVRAANKMTDTEFDDLSDEAANWLSTAVKALNAKAEIDDFEGPDDEEDEEPEETEEAEDEEAVEEAEAEEDNEAEEAKEEAKPKKEARKAPAKTSAKKDDKPPKKKEDLSRYDKLTDERNRYGIIKGTKTDDAIKMYEKGATSAQIVEKLGSRFYNILKTLEQKGHRVERSQSGVFKLTHADDLPKKGKK